MRRPSASTWYAQAESHNAATAARDHRAPKAAAVQTPLDLLLSSSPIMLRKHALPRLKYPPCLQAADTLLDASKRRAYDAELAEAAEAERRAEASQHAASSGRGMAQPPASLDEFPPWCFDSKGRPNDFLFLRCQCGPNERTHVVPWLREVPCVAWQRGSSRPLWST